MDSRRAESFSDGVFAVAITVLVFNLLSISQPGKVITAHLVLSAWPQYAAYLVSFVTIGIMWLNHHSMLSSVNRVDRITLVINIFLLMGVVAVPFPTALIADSLSAPRGGGPDGSTVATVTYGLLMIAIAIAYSAMWMHLAARQDQLAVRPIRVPRLSTLRFSAGSLGYVGGTLVAAFVSPAAALGIYGLIGVYYLFEHLPDSSGSADGAGGPDGCGPAGADGTGGQFAAGQPG